MKRILSSLGKRSPTRDVPSNYSDDAPEAVILREMTAFCEAGSNPGDSQGSEFVRLPSIVESAESSPNAAREAANLIRRLLADPATTPGHMQYNAIMLMRILIDNPGHTFTRNLDGKFVATVKEQLRQGRDLHVQNFLRQTLEALEIQRAWDEDLAVILQMWKKEKTKLKRSTSGLSFRSSQTQQPTYPIPRNNATLPPADELAARIEEAKNSGKLLIQFVQSTTPAEILDNELVKEFSDRCRTASRALQSYIHATDPAPDEDTLLTLIETNDELAVAQSKHQRAILNARKLLGKSGSQSPASDNDNASASGALRPLPAPPLPQRDSPSPPISPPGPAPFATTPAAATISPSSSNDPTSNGAARYEYRSEDFQVQNPFADTYSTSNTTPAPAK
ncbi:hypothetical protein FE257_006058 [Aspergillus nanangensis]|uniref:GAT domain-containing protein n=1 Tax=Aspergillus nanangensis TaxID=2582783 RepID=A0AAD4CPL6_ASPNN|nr:hypothetical protein FE257_006058 [Aspergillus nanangensis]